MDDEELTNKMYALGEDAFKAGWQAGFLEGMSEGMPGHVGRTMDQAWEEYDPPEELKI
jgi:hypothetical protein